MSTKSATTPDQAGLQLAEEIPGQSLQLYWQGESPRLWTRRIASLGFALAGLAWVNVIWYVIQEWNIERPGQKQEDLLLPAIMAVMSLYLFQVIGSAVGKSVGYFTELSWHSAITLFSAKRHGWLVWGNRSIAIPLEKILHVSVTLREERGGTAELSLLADKNTRTDVDLTSLKLNRNSAQELLFSIARITKAEGYLPADNTQGRFFLQAWRTRVDCLGDEPEDDEEADEFLPIPPLGKNPRVKTPGRPKAEDAVQSKSPLDLDRVAKSLSISRIDTWRPGELVRVIRPAAPWFVYALVSGVMLVPALLVGRSWVFSIARLFVPLEEGARWVTMGFTMAIVGLVIGFWLFNNLKTREVILDWTRNRLTLRFGPTLKHWSFGEVRELMLAEKLHNEVLEDPEDQTPYSVDGYGSALRLVLPGEDLLLIETETWEKEQDNARDVLAPLGRELANALHVRYYRGLPKNRDSDRVAKALRLTRPQQTILGLILLLALSLMISVGYRNTGKKQIVSKLQELGVEAKPMGSYQFEQHQVLQNYVSIRFHDRSVLQEHGNEIRELLAQVPRIGLNLEKSNLADADLEPLRGLKIKMVQMADTKLGDGALEILCAGDDLEFLDADGTKITDQSVPGLIRQPNLRFVFYRQTQVTFQGTTKLRAKDSLIKSAP